MEYTYQIIPEHELVVEKITGDVTVQELAYKTQAVFSDPQWRHGPAAGRIAHVESRALWLCQPHQ